MNPNRRLYELEKAIRDSSEYALHWTIESLNIAHRVFLGNSIELLKRIDAHSDPQRLSFIYFQQKHKEAQLEFTEITRRLQNYVASVEARSSQHRVILRKLLTDEQLRDYQQKLDTEIKTDPVAGFLKGLRNFMLHESQPPLAAQVEFNYPGPVAGIVLDSQKLLELGDFREPGRQIFVRHPEQIPLLEVVREYSEKVNAFHSWMMKFVLTAKATEVTRLSEMQKEWVSLAKSLGVPTTPEEIAEFGNRKSRPVTPPPPRERT